MSTFHYPSLLQALSSLALGISKDGAATAALGGCGAPPNLTFAELTRQYRNQLEFAVGDTVSYSCRPGHLRRPGVPQTLTCLQNHTWSEALEFCKRKQCRHPEPPRNGRVVVLTDLLFGSTVSYTCDEGGFTLRGHPMSQCQGDRRWHPPVPVCERVLHCSKPADITHGSFRGPAKAVFTVGTSVKYICEPGFSLLGTASIYCTASGAWSHPPPVCQGVFWLQELKGNASATFPSGATVSYSCDPGYSLVGNAFINCTGSGSWSQPLPQCKGESVLPLISAECGMRMNSWLHSEGTQECEFPDVQGVKKAIKGSTYRSGTNITLECDDGYVLEGISHTQCQEDFSWDPPVPACKLSEWNVNKTKIKQEMQILSFLKETKPSVVLQGNSLSSSFSRSYYHTYENYNYRTPLNPDTEHKGSCLP
uniref:Uncharacterized protein n=1 Tax=Geospiza parvula TaxID=87175 RepID=A0A8C3MRK8_GEOPR